MKPFFNKFNLFVVILIIILTVVLTWPAALHFGSNYIGDGGDNYEYASYQMLAAQRIKEGLSPFGFTNFWRFPVGFDFARGFDSYITVGLGALLTLATGMPYAYNLTIFILIFLNAFFSYLFFNRLTKSGSLGVIGMLIYGFSFYAIGKASSHPNLLFTGSIALFALSVLNIIQKTKYGFKDYLFVALSVLIIALGSSQYLLMAFMFSVFYLFLGLVFYKQKTILLVKNLINYKSLVSFGIFLGLFLIIYFPQISSIYKHTFVFLNRSDILTTLTPSLTDYLLPNKYLKLISESIVSAQSSPSIEKLVFLGFVEILLFGLFLAFFKRLNNKKFYIFLVFCFIVPFALSLGFGTSDNLWFLPYRFLSNLFPFSLIPETGRYVIFFNLVLAMILLSFLKDFGVEKNKYIIFLIFVLLVAERLPSGAYLASTLNNQPYEKIVREQTTSAVLDLPVNIYYPNYNIVSFSYQKPIVNGYFHWSADSQKEKSFILKDYLLTRYACDQNDPLDTSPINPEYENSQDRKMLNLLKENNIDIIVIHKDDKFFHPVCTAFRKRLSGLLAQPLSLALTPSDKETQVTNTYLEGNASFTYYFPKDGIFYLDGIYISPSKRSNFAVTLSNNQPFEGYSWLIDKNNSMQILPKDTLSVPVTAGSTITFSSNQETGNTFFSIWYRYVENNNSNYVPLKSLLQKLYEDDKTVVYKLE